MRILVLGSISLVVLACSSKEDAASPPAATPDAATTSDSGGGSDASSGGSDAAAEAGPDPKKACETLGATIAANQPKLTLSGANKHPFAEAPTAAGGTIADGTYQLTAYDRYSDQPSNPAGEVQDTIVFQGGLYELVSRTGSGVGTPNEVTGGGSYTTTNNEVTWKYGCGEATGGPSLPGKQSGPYTVMGNTLAFIILDGAGTTITKTTYTKL